MLIFNNYKKLKKKHCRTKEEIGDFSSTGSYQTGMMPEEDECLQNNLQTVPGYSLCKSPDKYDYTYHLHEEHYDSEQVFVRVEDELALCLGLSQQLSTAEDDTVEDIHVPSVSTNQKLLRIQRLLLGNAHNTHATTEDLFSVGLCQDVISKGQGQLLVSL
jgi:hypothetical protein